MTRNINSAASYSLNSFRRDVLKAAGASGALAMLGTTASASQHDATGDETDVADDAPDDVVVDAETGTVHVVRTLITPSTSPDRPADFFYQPTGLHVAPGDVVKFVFETPDHNVTSYHPAYGMQRRVPLGVEQFSSPILGWEPRSIPGDMVDPPAEPHGENGEETDADPELELRPSTWLYAFETPGVYDMECAPHEAFGMAMRVVVGDETETAFETSDPEQLPPPRAGPVGLSRVVLTDAALEPEAIIEAGHIGWMELEANQQNDDRVDDVENGSDDGVNDDETDE